MDIFSKIKHADAERGGRERDPSMAKRGDPIRDKMTGKTYASKYQAGVDLRALVDGDPNNRYVWFQIARAFPKRFQTLVDKKWVDVNYDAPQPARSAPSSAIAEEAGTYAVTGTKTTTIEIDQSKFANVKEILGTTTLRETVERSFDEVITRAARERSVKRLQRMDGLDLDKPKVTADAWR